MMIDKKQNIFKSKYGIGEMVYLKTDPDKSMRLIISVKFITGSSIIYTLVYGTQETLHYENEICYEKPFLNY